jgi:hypothetical protein
MSEVIKNLLKDVPLPRFVRVRQEFSKEQIEDVPSAVFTALQPLKLQPGMRICLTCGSRGIDNNAVIIRAVVDFCKQQGAEPFAIPAMGSHGGATAEGQREMLRSLGITEEAIGCPIYSSMETKCIGTTEEGHPVQIDKYAAESDGIIVINRIKPHTSFRGAHESGLFKMMAIGLAKQKGADMTHYLRYEHFADNLIEVATRMLEHLNIIGGIATVENGYDKIAEIHVLKAEEIPVEEPKILDKARSYMSRILVDDFDALVEMEIGKSISGAGMDTNIVGRYHTRAASGGPNTIKLGVLNVTEKSEGNANGMGLADFMPRHMYDDVDFEVSYMNTLTSTEPNSTRVPMVLANDKEVFQGCVKLCGQINPDDIRMVIIRSTKYLDEVYMSEAAVKAAVMPIEVVSDYQEVPFDENDNLVLFEQH